MPVALPSILILAALALPGTARAAGATHWQPPVRGFTVERGFSFDRRAPFEAGRRRVAYLSGPAGSPVRAPCSGPVLFAGAVPGGAAASVGCGPLLATLTGLGGLSVRAGRPVAAGEPVGHLGATGRFGLGARRAGDRFAYVDPLRLIGPGRRVPLLAPARRPARPLLPARRPSSRPGHRFPVAATLLAGAWLGLGLAGSAIGIGIAFGGSRRARAAPGPARPAGR